MFKFLVILALIWSIPISAPAQVSEKPLASASPTTSSLQNQANDTPSPRAIDDFWPDLTDQFFKWGPWFFSFCLVIVGCLQYRLLRNQVDAQVTAERAWILISQTDSSPVFQQNTSNVFRATIQNVGKTPARLTKIAARYSNLNKAEFGNLRRKSPDYGNADSKENIVLVPKGSFPKTVRLEPEDRFKPEDEKPFLYGDRVLYFYARVEYVDAFGKTRETRVGYEYHFQRAGSVEPAGFWQGGPPAYNRAT